MTKRMQVTMKDDVYNSLEKLAEDLGVSKSVVITLAIQEYERKQEIEKKRA